MFQENNNTLYIQCGQCALFIQTLKSGLIEVLTSTLLREQAQHGQDRLDKPEGQPGFNLVSLAHFPDRIPDRLKKSDTKFG